MSQVLSLPRSWSSDRFLTTKAQMDRLTFSPAGGCVTIVYALGLLLRPNVVREYAAA